MALSVIGPADAGVEFGSVQDGLTDIVSGKIQGLENGPLQRESVEAMLRARGDEHGGVLRPPAKVDRDALGFVRGGASGGGREALKASQEPAVTLVAEDVVGAVTVRDVEVAVGSDGSLGRMQRHFGGVSADGDRVAQRELFAAAEVEPRDPARLLRPAIPR